MLKKLIKYVDYDGRERSENFYFYLNKAELMEMELGVDGGMQQMIQLIIDKQDIPKIMNAFKTIILKAYGESLRMAVVSLRVRNCPKLFLRQKHTLICIWN